MTVDLICTMEVAPDNVIAIPLAAGVLYKAGVILSPAAGAALMALSTVIVAINARFLNVTKSQTDEP